MNANKIEWISGRDLERYFAGDDIGPDGDGVIGYARRNKARASLEAYLMRDRLENYGYNWKDFRRLQNQRARVKAHARRTMLSLSHVEGEGRLSYAPSIDAWEYTTGQSNNEEITNLIARVYQYPQRGWLS